MFVAIFVAGLLPASFSQLKPAIVDPTYDTDVCSQQVGDNPPQYGSRCYTPKTNGPCTRQTDCKFEN